MAVDLEEIERQIFALIADDQEDVTLDDLTQEVLEGAGVFDTLMRAMSNHLEKEHSANRITGDQYATVYSAALTQVLQQSIAFLLGKGKFRLERGLTLLQLAKLDKEIALLCQKLVTEKAQVMDRTILDPTADDDTSPTDGDGNHYWDTIQPVEGTIGERNRVLCRQVKGYDDNYKTNVGKTILDTYRTLLSNLGNDSGVSFPPSITDAGTDYIMKALKMDSGLQDLNNDNSLGRDNNFYWNENIPEPKDDC